MSASSSGLLEYSDNTADMGSAAFRWDNIYCNNVNVAGSLITADIISYIDGVTLTTTATSIEFTGLNGDDYFCIYCTAEFIPNTSSCNYVSMILNGDSASNYSVHNVIGTTHTVTTSRTSTVISFLNGTTTASYLSRTDMYIFTKAGTYRGLFANNVCGNTMVESTNYMHSTWKNSADTITSIKFIMHESDGTIRAFDPGTVVKLWRM